MVAKASIGLGTDLSDLRRELAKLPNLSGEAAQEMLIKVEAAVAKAEAVSKKAIKSTSKAQRWAAKEAEKAAAQARDRMVALGTAAISAGVALGAMAQQVADLRNDLADASTRSGVAAETLAGLRLAAEGSGLAFEDMIGVTDKLPGILAKAAKGTGKQAEAFATLGIAVTDVDGALRSSDEVLKETLNALSDIEDPTTRAALATEALGKSGTKLLQALGDPASLDAFTAMAERFGVEHGPQAAESAAQWQRAMANLNLVFDGTKARLLDAFGGGGALVENFTRGFIAASTFIIERVKTMLEGFKGIGRTVKLVFAGEFSEAAEAAKGAFTDLYLNYGDAKDAALNAVGAFNTLNKRMEDAAAGATNLGEAEEDSGQNIDFTTERLKEQARAAAELAKAQESVANIAKRATEDQLSEANKVRIARDEELTKLQEFADAHQANAELLAEIEAARVEVIARAERDVADIRSEALKAETERLLELTEERKKAAEEAARIAKEAADEETAAQIAAHQTRLDYADQALGAIGDLSDALIERQMAGLEEGTAAHRRAAKRQFAIQKALAIAGAVVDAGKAALMSIATLGPPVPPNIPGIAGVAVAGAIGAASIATIAASSPPQFFIGGMVGKGPGAGADSSLITAHRGEAVLNRRAVERIGEQGVRDLNQGKASAGPQTIVVQSVYKHRVLDTQLQEEARIPGSTLRAAAKQGARVGHRSRSTA